ncbi:MAG: hypothetical protein K2X77_15805 [Candidatus Obscuribacterales bacterium]|nr:hypothetical protein [Candidatus Obscuribacterales bacterium]
MSDTEKQLDSVESKSKDAKPNSTEMLTKTDREDLVERQKQAGQYQKNPDRPAGPVSRQFGKPEIVDGSEDKGNGKRDAAKNDASFLKNALKEREQWVFGRSNDKLEEVIRQKISTMTREQLSQMSASFSAENGGVGFGKAIQDSSLSQASKDALQIYLKGCENRSDADTLKLAAIALESRNIAMFTEAFRGASASARKEFMEHSGDERMQEAFCERIYAQEESIPRLDTYEYLQAKQYAQTGKLSAELLVKHATGTFHNSEGEINNAIDNMSSAERAKYLIGKELSQGGKVIPGLSEEQKGEFLSYYQKLHSVLENTVTIRDANTQVAKLEDRLINRGSTLVTELAEQRGVFGRHDASSVMSKIENMKESDWQRLKVQPHFRKQIEETLANYLSADELLAAKQLLDKKVAAEKFEKTPANTPEAKKAAADSQKQASKPADFNEALDQYSNRTGGLGSFFADDTQVRDAVNKFAQVQEESNRKFAELPENEKKQMTERLVRALDAFKESKGAAADHLVDAVMTGGTLIGSIGGAIPSGGVSLALLGTVGSIGAGLRVTARAAIQSSDYEFSKWQLAEGFLSGTLNVLGPGELGQLFRVGEQAALKATAKTTEQVLSEGLQTALKAEASDVLKSGTSSMLNHAIANGAKEIEPAAITALAEKMVASELTGTSREAAVKTLSNLMRDNLKAAIEEESKAALTGMVKRATLSTAAGAAGAGTAGALDGFAHWDHNKDIATNLKIAAEKALVASAYGAGGALAIHSALGTPALMSSAIDAASSGAQALRRKSIELKQALDDELESIGSNLSGPHPALAGAGADGGGHIPVNRSAMDSPHIQLARGSSDGPSLRQLRREAWREEFGDAPVKPIRELLEEWKHDSDHPLVHRHDLEEYARIIENNGLKVTEVLGAGGNQMAIRLKDGTVLKIGEKNWVDDWGTRKFKGGRDARLLDGPHDDPSTGIKWYIQEPVKELEHGDSGRVHRMVKKTNKEGEFEITDYDPRDTNDRQQFGLAYNPSTEEWDILVLYDYDAAY